MGIETILHLLVRGPLPSSLDDLVQSLQQAWNEVGLPGFMAMLLQAIDALLITQWRQGQLTPPACCDDPVYEVCDWQVKRLRTSLGRVVFRWRRLCCRHCHHSWVPLRETLHLQPHQQASRELEQTIVTQSTEQSYRKVAAGVSAQVGATVTVGKSTACNWVHKQQATLMPVNDIAPAHASTAKSIEPPPADPEADEEPASPGTPTRIPILLADGTNYQARTQAKEPGQTRGEVRVVLGMTTRGNVIPIGVWSGVSWRRIGAEVQERIKHVVCLVSDGERGLVEGLRRVAAVTQRCHWHLQHDLSFMLWQDHVPRKRGQQLRCLLIRILAIKLPPSTHGAGTPHEQAQLQRRMERAEARLRYFIRYLARRGWHHSATFLQHAYPHTFTYIRCFMDTGLRVPRTSNRIERLMETIAPRLKYLGRNWTNQGAAQIVDFIVQIATRMKHWVTYWHDRLQATGSTQVEFQMELGKQNS